jgi:hypothetical protein
MDPESAFALGVLPGTTINVDPASAFPVAGQAGVAAGTGTGAHGITPLTGGSGAMTDALDQVWDWLNEPFTRPMSPTGIFLTVGAVLIAILIWNLILYHIRIAAESI